MIVPHSDLICQISGVDRSDSSLAADFAPEDILTLLATLLLGDISRRDKMY